MASFRERIKDLYSPWLEVVRGIVDVEQAISSKFQ